MLLDVRADAPGRIVVREVGGDVGDSGAERLRQRPQPVVTPRDEDQRSVRLTRKQAGGRLADAAGGAGDEGDHRREATLRGCPARSGSTTWRSRSATSRRRWPGTAASWTSSCAVGAPRWPGSTSATSSSRSARRAARVPTRAATSASSSTIGRPCGRRSSDAGIEVAASGGLRFVDPWGNQVEVVDYRDVQFTKAPAILAGLAPEGLHSAPRRARSWPARASPGWRSARLASLAVGVPAARCAERRAPPTAMTDWCINGLAIMRRNHEKMPSIEVLDGKVAIVAPARREGSAAATAELLSGTSAQVLINDLDSNVPATACKIAGETIIFSSNLARQAPATTGATAIDAWAGSTSSSTTPATRSTARSAVDDDLPAIYDIRTIVPSGSSTRTPHLRGPSGRRRAGASRSGKIVNVSSIFGTIGDTRRANSPPARPPSSASTKHWPDGRSRSTSTRSPSASSTRCDARPRSTTTSSDQRRDRPARHPPAISRDDQRSPARPLPARPQRPQAACSSSARRGRTGPATRR